MKKLLENDSVNVIQSIKNYYNLGCEHSTHKRLDEKFNTSKPKHVVLMCLDGLGYSFLSKTPFLNTKVMDKIDTVYPPTTACATISLQTGLYPCEHGWIGWAQYYKEYDAVIELFSGHNYSTGEFHNPNEVNKDILFKPFYDDITNCKKFLPSFDPNGYDDFNDLLEGVKSHINNNETSFSYVYWNEPDHILHMDGADGVESIKVIKDIDEAIKKFSNNLKDTLVVITADHGHIDSEGLHLKDFPKLMECFKRLPSVEPRCINMFIKDDMHNQLKEECLKLSNDFDLYTKEEFINSDFFNKGKMHFKINDFLGDYILIAKGKYFFFGHKPVDPTLPPLEFKSMHAGSTELEMEIPLIIIE